MSYRRPITEAAPDYTNAFLWSSGLLLFMVFLTLAALTGLWVVFALAWVLDRAIRRLGQRLASRE